MVLSDVRLLRGVTIPLRDGTPTSAEVWLPDDGRPHPAILVRTPYLKELAAPTAVVDPRLATERGYAVVLQDVRGRGASADVFEPFVNEERDGYDSVGWAADQPWCDGRVFMAGASYYGATQWLAAASAPPALCGIAPALSTDEYGDGWTYTAGVPELGFLTSWCATELAPAERRMLDDPPKAWTDLAATEAIAPWLQDWLRNPPESEFWRERSVAHRRTDIKVPVFVAAGWYDIFLAGSLRSFERSRDPRDRLVVGPWAHNEALSHLVGEANVGIAGLGLGTYFRWLLDFNDALLAGCEPTLPRVRAYALGARRWVDLDGWPPPDASPSRFSLDAGEFRVDSASPVPTLGGRGLLTNVPREGHGIVDQRPLAARSDVFVAMRARLEKSMLLAGPMAASVACELEPDGNEEVLWVATICVEQPNGALHNLAEGVARVQAGAAHVHIALGHTLAWLQRGSTLVLLLAGSSYPRWPRPKADATLRVLPGSSLEVTIAPVLESTFL